MSEELPILSTPEPAPEAIKQRESERPAEQAPVLTAEQIQAVDAVFITPSEEEAVAGLLALWANTPMLAEMAHDHFRKEKPEERVSEGQDDQEA